MAVFPTRLLLATDGSPDAERAAQTAVELSQQTGSELHLVHVGEFLPTYLAQTEEEPAQLREAARRLLEEETRKVSKAGAAVAGSHLRLGRPAEEVVALSEELSVGVIIVGSRGMSALRRALMGSVSDSVVRHAHCPVFVVRANDAGHANP
jgi:nucleotide-binding universal stress UspA family protein